ncbi:MAG TPA: NAD-dependent protein deacylase, partial [Clostridiaceae bacterium]|nr:NAD-dependent protein deacylase [Clostridiaceae bacterium]
AIQQSDLLIVGGTSLTVYPAAGLIQFQRNGKLVIVNRDRTGSEPGADLVINEPIGELFDKIRELRKA